MKIIDARGESCPTPVIMLKKALKDALAEGNKENIKEIVDNELSKENLEKMLIEIGLRFTSYKEEDNYVVQVDIVDTELEQENQSTKTNSVIVFSSDQMGRGNDELGKILIKNFIYALTESDSLPSAILMYNTGVKLAAENEETISDLKKLDKKGVEILVCGLCLNYFGLEGKLQVGSVTNMYSILQKKLLAAKVIQL